MPWNSDSGLVLGVEVEVGCGNVGLAVGYDESARARFTGSTEFSLQDLATAREEGLFIAGKLNGFTQM